METEQAQRSWAGRTATGSVHGNPGAASGWARM